MTCRYSWWWEKPVLVRLHSFHKFYFEPVLVALVTHTTAKSHDKKVSSQAKACARLFANRNNIDLTIVLNRSAITTLILLLVSILFTGLMPPEGIIAVTQPRRVAATSVAQRVSEEMDCRLGAKVQACMNPNS